MIPEHEKLGEKKVPVVKRDHISSWPPNLVKTIQRSLSPMEPNSFQLFDLQIEGGDNQVYLIGRDSANRFWSLPMNREAGLDSGLIIKDF